MRDVLIVIDMQNDFVSGALRNQAAIDVVPFVVGRVVEGMNLSETLIFTRDTHAESYLHTQEGKYLPVPHCLKGSEGWQIIPQLTEYTQKAKIIDKPTFGSLELAEYLRQLNEEEKIGEVTLIGTCTDICVISNALILKAALPEAEIVVDASCCAGVSVEAHKNALTAMKSCQVNVIHDEE